MHVTEVMGQAGKNPQAIEKPGLRAGCGPSRKHQSPSSCLLDGLPAFGKSYARPCVFNQVQGERSDASCPRMLSSEGPAIAISPAVLRRERANHSRKTLVSAFGLKTVSGPIPQVHFDDENLATELRSLKVYWHFSQFLRRHSTYKLGCEACSLMAQSVYARRQVSYAIRFFCDE